MYKLVFYVPESHLESVKSAVFKAGAGKIGNYDQCSWQVCGTGQFRPLAGSDAFVGTEGRLETIEEFRVELVCAEEFIRQSLAALKNAHPYEEVAYDVWRLENL